MLVFDFQNLRIFAPYAMTYWFTELKKKCSEGWVLNPFRNTCIIMEQELANHSTAVTKCQKSGGSLAIFDSLKSYEWLVSLKNLNSGKSI